VTCELDLPVPSRGTARRAPTGGRQGPEGERWRRARGAAGAALVPLSQEFASGGAAFAHLTAWQMPPGLACGQVKGVTRYLKCHCLVSWADS
jgi:hypothetical protein